jgi:hypothetical protein
MENDPRWPEHRARMMDSAAETTRITLLEIGKIAELRRKGATSSTCPKSYASAQSCGRWTSRLVD